MKGPLRTLLLAQSSITTLVGAKGVYIQHAAQGAALPHIVIQQEGSNEFNTLDAPSGQFRAIDFEIDCKGPTAADADALAETVRTFIKDYAGPAGSQTIDAVILDDVFDSVEKPIDGSDKKTFVVTLPVTIQYHPA